MAAFEEYHATGLSSLKCESCGQLVIFEALSEPAWKSSCQCGQYNDTLRGL
jgi:hypothetical protein